MAINSINSYNANRARISGMISGMDTDTLVKQLMKLDQAKVDKESRKLTTMQWKQDAYRDINTKLREFREKSMSTLNQTNNLLTANNFYASKVTMLDNSSAVTISTKGQVQAGTWTIDSVSQLAKGASTSSAAKVSTNGQAISDNNNVALKDLKLAKPLKFEAGYVQFEINGEKFSFSQDDTLQTVMNTVNGNSKANVNLSYSRLSDTFSISSKAMGADSKLEINNIAGNMFGAESAFGLESGSFQNGQNAKLSINGVAIERNSNSFEIDGVLFQLNKTTQVPEAAKAAAMSSAGKVSQAGQSLNLNTALKDLPLSNGMTFVGGYVKFSINGQEFTFNRNDTMQTVMNGINNSTTANAKLTYDSTTDTFALTSKTPGANSALNVQNLQGNLFGSNSAIGLKPETLHAGQDAIAAGSSISFKIEQDPSAVVSKIQDFVKNYNALMDTLYGYYNDTAKSGYQPLTDEEKEGMSETQIKQWEDQAKGGLLRRDENIAGLMQELRGAFYDTIKGLGVNAASIGLKTESYAYGTTPGKISLDVDQLTEAVKTNPDKVMNIFTKTTTGALAGSSKYEDSGIAVIISQAMVNYTSRMTKGLLVTNDSAISKQKNLISSMQDKLYDTQEQYYKKFTAMETALAKIQSQSSSFTAMLGGS